MATAIQLTRTNGNQSTAWLPQVLWRENAERLISQWRPSIILEAKLGHRHDIIRSVASLNLNSTAIYIYHLYFQLVPVCSILAIPLYINSSLRSRGSCYCIADSALEVEV